MAVAVCLQEYMISEIVEHSKRFTGGREVWHSILRLLIDQDLSYSKIENIGFRVGQSYFET